MALSSSIIMGRVNWSADSPARRMFKRFASFLSASSPTGLADTIFCVRTAPPAVTITSTMLFWSTGTSSNFFTVMEATRGRTARAV